MGVEHAGHVVPGTWGERVGGGAFQDIVAAEGAIRGDDESQAAVGPEVQAVGLAVDVRLVLGGENLPLVESLGAHPADERQAAGDVEPVLVGVVDGEVLAVVALEVGGQADPAGGRADGVVIRQVIASTRAI